MTNEEKLNQQITDLSELFRGMFTAEEIKEMEQKYNEILSGSKE